MAHYRLYFFNSRTGRIDRFEEFDAEDDDQALDAIDSRIGDCPLELWSAGRKIGRFEAALALSGIASEGLWARRQHDSLPRRLFSH